MKKLTKALILPALVVASFCVMSFNADVYAAVDPGKQITQGVTDAGGTSGDNLKFNFKDIINVLLYIIGAIAVIMIVVGGLRYVLSGGDSSAVTGAKNTILYAVVGLIVALLAYAIVNFVVTSFS